MFPAKQQKTPDATQLAKIVVAQNYSRTASTPAASSTTATAVARIIKRVTMRVSAASFCRCVFIIQSTELTWLEAPVEVPLRR